MLFLGVLIAVIVVIIARVIMQKAVPELPVSWHALEKDKNRDYFVLVIDHSLSIKEHEMGMVIKGAQRLIAEMPLKASASIVIFSDIVEHIQVMTNDQITITNRLKGIRPDGLSAFHGGLVKALDILKGYDGRRAIFFFTDGRDDRSGYSLAQVQKIAVSEGIRVYGVGVGDIDKDKLKDFSSATGGIFGKTKTYRSLTQVFPFMLSHYYDSIKNRSDAEGVLVIRSFPDNQKIYVDEELKGVTPLRIEKTSAGHHAIRVDFEKGDPVDYTVPVEAGKRTVVDLRASGRGRDLVLGTMPGHAAAFVDGTYVGMTGKFNTEFARENWRSAIEIDQGMLLLKNISFGEHALSLPGKPELNSGFGLDMETHIGFDLNRSVDKAAIISVLYSKKVMKTNLKKTWSIKDQ